MTPTPFDFRLASLLGNGTAIGGGNTTASAEDMQRALAFAKQYDPNASIDWEGQGQFLKFNNALMPQNVLGGRGIEGIARGTPGSGEKLANPDAVLDDPIFGRVTAPQNLREKGPSMVDILGPLMVGGFAGLAGGGLGLLGNAVSKAPGMISNVFSRGPESMSPQMMALLRYLSLRNGG
jgi:hypothetical protein